MTARPDRGLSLRFLAALGMTTRLRMTTHSVGGGGDPGYGPFGGDPTGVPSAHFWTFTTTSALGVPEPLTAIGSAFSLVSPNIDGVAPGT